MTAEIDPKIRAEAARRVADVRTWMRANADEARAAAARRFFREDITLYGLPSGLNRRRAAELYKEIKLAGGLPLALEMADLLYAPGNMEEAACAEELLRRFHRQFDRAAFDRFAGWVNRVNNWASCDGLSMHLLGGYFLHHAPPERLLLAWTRSKNRWRRRAAAASLVRPARAGLHLETALRVAEALLPVRDDLIEKAAGWLLKEAARTPLGRKQVVDLLGRSRAKASRLTLRCAAEKWPAALKAQLLG